MNIKSILVVTDLSAREDLAIERAAQLAGTHRATVRLMYVPAAGEVPHPAAAARLTNAARQLQDRLGLRVKTAPVKAHKLEDLAAEARGMNLVVLAHRHERSTAAFFRGEPVVRLLRRCGCPVLVARRASGEHYRRTLVAVDFSETSQALVKLAGAFDGRADLEVFHAISTQDEAKLRPAEAPGQVVRAYREGCLRQAQEQVVAIGASLAARTNPVLTIVGLGDPGRQAVIRQEHSGADLLVLGKRRSSAWQDFFCASVAHRVLSWGSSDVLVVPDAYLQATAPGAARPGGKVASALHLRPRARRAS
jgi:nucleotide-binding universal stress UspA family protein